MALLSSFHFEKKLLEYFEKLGDILLLLLNCANIEY